MTTKGNDAAFAAVASFDVGQEGCSKRELFAAMAMQGAMASSDIMFSRVIPGGQYDGWTEGKLAAKYAVEAADYLLAALNQESTK